MLIYHVARTSDFNSNKTKTSHARQTIEFQKVESVEHRTRAITSRIIDTQFAGMTLQCSQMFMGLSHVVAKRVM